MAQMKTRIHWDDVQPHVKTALRRGVFNGLEYMLDKSNAITPHDEGILEGTGTVTLDPKKIKGTISYNTPYAIRLHEHPEYNFQRGRKGKWLELTVEKEKDKMQQYLQSSLSQLFR